MFSWLTSMIWMLGMVAISAVSTAELVAGTDANMYNESSLPWMEGLNKPLIRLRRSNTGNSNCNAWSSWINDSSPNASTKTEDESWSQTELDIFCPPSVQGNITQMRCQDDKGEIFQGSREDGDHQYWIDCGNISTGVVCAPQRTNAASCPDLSVSYYCSCASTIRIGIDEGDDDGNSEKSEDICGELSRAILLQHIPVDISLLVIIIMCAVIIFILVKKKLTTGPIPKPATISPA